MRKKNILLTVAFSLLFLSIILHTPIGSQLHLQIIKPVKAEKTIIVPTNYTKIQDAIDAADSGDTIYVYNGTYYEHVVVNKTVTLIGENKNITIIDGEGTGIVILSNASDIEIRGFTIQNGGVFPDSGILLGRRSINNTIRDNIIRNNAYGITLSGSNGCSIIDNMIMNNSWTGVQIKDSNNSIIYENTIVNNSRGVEILTVDALNNTLYHNNFIDNLAQASSFAPTTKWDNGTEGNYWSDYMGEDSDGNGIGDTPYTIPYGTDNYPLMKPFGDIGDIAKPIIGTPYQEPLEPNEGENVTISVNVTDKDSGVKNVTLSYSINEGANWTDVPMINLTGNTYEGEILGQLNGTKVWYKITAYDNAENFAVDDNAGEYYIYIVIPEFPATILLPLFIILTLVTVILRKKKKGTLKL